VKGEVMKTLDECKQAVMKVLPGRTVAEESERVAARITSNVLLRELAARGLAEEVHADLRYWRERGGAETTAEGAASAGLTHSRPNIPRGKFASSALWDVWYEGADGTQKSWMQFTRDDLAHVRTWVQARIQGLRDVDARIDKTWALLDEFNKQTVQELPAAAIQAIEEL
jgi:hypothetical protein